MRQETDPYQNPTSDAQQQRSAACAVTTPSDEVLLERIQSRDERALEILIKRYNRLLRGVAGPILTIEQDVTDAVEETFLGVWNLASNFDISKGKAIGWIVTMARRRAIDRVRRRQAYDRAEMRFRLSNNGECRHFATDDVSKNAARADNAAAFAKLILRLPEAQQQVVHMAFYQGLSHREIARKTSLPLGTVKTRLELGLKKLRAAVCAIGSRDQWLSATA